MPPQAGTESGPVGGAGAWDEEDERQLWLLKLEHAALDALATRELLQQEQQLLAFAAQRGAQRGGPGEMGAPASTSGRAEEAARVAMREKLFGIAGALGGADRERMKQEVSCGVSGLWCAVGRCEEDVDTGVHPQHPAEA